jgi:chromosome partitioning protein
MATVIGFANQKGGVAKTSSALATGQLLHRSGFRVLYVDMDPQGNLSHSLKAVPQKGSILEVLTGDRKAEEVVQKTGYSDCLCYSPSLAGTDRTLDKVGKEYLLKEALDEITGNYAYIIIDPPPALGILTVNTLVACQYVVIPSQADIYSLQGIGEIAKTIDTVRRYCNSALKIAGILITRFNAHTIIGRKIAKTMEDMAGKLQTKVFKSRIRECVAVKEAEAQQVELYSYAPQSNASLDYFEFVKELIGDLNAGKTV